MAKLPQSAWAALWVANGGNPKKADLASAVVMGESGGDSTVDTNPCCKGGYQINVEVGNTSRACAMNAVCSTRWAIKNSNNGRDWSQWEAFTDGSYKSFLGGSGKTPRNKHEAKTILASAPFHLPLPGPLDPGQVWEEAEGIGKGLGGAVGGLFGEGGGPIGEISSSIRGINAFFVGFGELILTPEGWLRLSKLLGGSILVFWGLRIVIRESTGTDPINAATKTASKGAELAALAATVK